MPGPDLGGGDPQDPVTGANSPDTQDARDLELIRDAAIAAGEIAMRWFQAPVDSWAKPEGAGPVSEADLAVNDMLQAELTAARPDYGWFSEETADDLSRRTRERVFIVDPIDGTRAFLAGETGFCHAIALIDQGAPRAAAVHLPARDETYVALLGSGATLNGAPITVSSTTELDGSNLLVSRSQLKSPRWGGRPPEAQFHFQTRPHSSLLPRGPRGLRRVADTAQSL